jgi:hypothetical protein
MRTSSPQKPIQTASFFPSARALENVSSFSKNVVKFSMKMLSQHFSEKSCINIFREKTLDSTFLRKVSSTFFIKMLINIFSKCYNIFREKNQHFLPLSSTFIPSPVGGGARRLRRAGVAESRGLAAHQRAGPPVSSRSGPMRSGVAA